MSARVRVATISLAACALFAFAFIVGASYLLIALIVLVQIIAAIQAYAHLHNGD